MERNICSDRLGRLLRYGRKNDGSWDEGECDCPPESHCDMLDDGDVDDIIKGLKALEMLKKLVGPDMLPSVEDTKETQTKMWAVSDEAKAILEGYPPLSEG